MVLELGCETHLQSGHGMLLLPAYEPVLPLASEGVPPHEHEKGTILPPALEDFPSTEYEKVRLFVSEVEFPLEHEILSFVSEVEFPSKHEKILSFASDVGA